MADEYGTRTHRYDDIIDLPHHQSKTHPHMSMFDRAAQFSPFSALTGHDEAIRETARLTEEKAELSEDEKLRLNEKLAIAAASAGSSAVFRFIYYVPDKKKSGGAYVSCTGSIKKVDALTGAVVLGDNTVIEINQISDIESELFDVY